jgi:uncharacterized glyoxalase superfamily protein PhnB
METTTEIPARTIWPCVNYADAPAGIAFLAALGFEERLVVRAEDEPDVVEHAELRWPEGGGLMCGSAGRGDEPFASMPTGASNIYVVTDDPDAVHDRAAAAGATVVRPMREEDYGSRGFTVADAEGNLWSFGTYRGA